MSFAKNTAPAPLIRPFLNLGFPWDILTGAYHLGKHGESILNGGLAYVTGIVGRGNTFKSVIAFFMLLRVLDRYLSADGTVYDTEMSVTINRLFQLAMGMDHIAGVDLVTEGRLQLTDKTVYTGNAFYDMLKKFLAEKFKDGAKNKKTTPFQNREKVSIPAFIPTVSAFDSFSQFTTDSVIKIQERAEVGEAGRNMEALRDAHAKNQLMMELPVETAKAGCYVILTAHAGDELKLDPYAAPKKKLTFLKGDVKIKNVPEKFTFLTNNCWYAMGAAPLINPGTKAVEFPRDTTDDQKDDTDLMCVTIIQLRGKSGPTGMPFDILVSQSEGVKVGLSAYWYLKQYEKYGIGGNDRNYFIELRPDVNLSRTTIRGKLDDDYRLQRAMEITAEMCQMNNSWHHLPDGLLVSPKELYEGIKKRGYDWDRLLDTRSYWVFEEEEDSHKPFCSTMDLLNMNAGTYHPWWYGDVKKESK